jgi:hypothetical protein
MLRRGENSQDSDPRAEANDLDELTTIGSDFTSWVHSMDAGNIFLDGRLLRSAADVSI